MSVLSKSIKDELKEIIEKVPIFKTNEEKDELLR